MEHVWWRFFLKNIPEHDSLRAATLIQSICWGWILTLRRMLEGHAPASALAPSILQCLKVISCACVGIVFVSYGISHVEWLRLRRTLVSCITWQDIPSFLCLPHLSLSHRCTYTINTHGLPISRTAEDQVGGQSNACLPALRRDVVCTASRWWNHCDGSKNEIFGWCCLR